MSLPLPHAAKKEQPVNRRDFLITSVGAAATTATGWSQSADHRSADPKKLDRIGVMTLSFSSILKNAAHPDDPKRTLDILDVPQMLADRYGIHHVEFQHAHFASTEPAYFKEVRERLRKAKSSMNQICLEFGPLNISTPDPVLRLETIDLTKSWIDHAAELECPRVMLNHGTLAPEVRTNAIATLKTIGDYGKKKKVFVTLESRGHAISATNASWETVVEVIKAAGIHANPDTGNFPDEAARHAGLRAMYPLSSGSSHAHYDPQRYSEADAIAISKELGYKGLYSIEATPVNGPDPYVAVQTIIDELLKDI
jgi:hypothetical protein